MQTVAEHLATALAQQGISTAFGIPGGETLSLLEALHSAGLRFVLTRHETAAGLMAEGLHLTTGAPGLLVATVGPGAANCPNAVAQASLDRVPLVVVTGNVAAGHRGRFTHQVFDQQAVLRPLVKASYALSPDTAARDIARGLQQMQEGRPGPVHFDLPLDVAVAPCPPAHLDPVQVADPDPDAVAEAASRLAQARNPLVLVGLEAIAASGLRPLVERLGAPAIGTYKAIGALPSSHPQWIGAAGLSPKADAVLLPLVEQADVVLLAGYDAVEMRSSWLGPFARDAFVIDVSAAPSAPPEHRTDLRLVGPVPQTLGAILEASPNSRRGLGGPWSTARDALGEAFPASSEWGPAGVITAIQRAVDPDTVVTCDTGAHRILLSQMWQADHPRTLLQSSGLCTMAYALPTAIGAALGSQRRVVAVMGDGGIEMAPGDLATARELGVDVTVVVIDDRSLALIEKKQRALGFANVGVDFADAGTDFVKLAEAFGMEARRFDDVETLRAWLAEPARGLRLAHCPIARRSYDGRL